ncbi:hypothetical protein FSP39_020096 [Pinctada imbricata]|uniref:Protein kinase-like protein SgK196 n=1 Tax=Pinctada imbricata TaxID=66713 RepID=A0AA88Y5K3_PINIB|nr:hypothetical protein FSP39_020096 [Pinctada imbricata]
MNLCEPKLNCTTIGKEVKKGDLLGQGAVKKVYLASWRGHSVVWNEPNVQNNFTADYNHGTKMLKELQSPYVTQILGWCNSIVITEYHKLGTARNVNEILDSSFGKADKSAAAKFRIQLCIDYAEILSYLHHGKTDKTFVMCDSNDLEKTLSQYLLTADLHLVLNDVDSLAVIDNELGNMIKCGHKELNGDFVAPEQLWPFEDRDFVDSEMPPYNEKTDIWKIPNVCNFFLDSHTKNKLQLMDIHLKCKNVHPNRRPSATEILETYKNILLE